QGALGLRAGAPADEAGARARSLRGPQLERSSPPRTPQHDRLCVPAAPQTRGKSARRLKRAAPPPKPSLPEIRRQLVLTAILNVIRLRCPYCHEPVTRYPSGMT